MSNEGLEKLVINLPNHWAIGSESLWATPLGNDLYQIENIPFFAYGLNFLDIVLATAYSDESMREIRKVVKPSGHRTYRIIFEKEMDRESQINLLSTLEKYEASYERANNTNVAVTIKPTSDYLAFFSQLEKYEQAGFLSFETCQARIEGSFDDIPD